MPAARRSPPITPGASTWFRPKLALFDFEGDHAPYGDETWKHTMLRLDDDPAVPSALEEYGIEVMASAVESAVVFSVNGVPRCSALETAATETPPE